MLLTLATEDRLSEAVALRLLDDYPAITIGRCIRRNGNGYLRQRLPAFSEMARHAPVLVLTDLDTNLCPAMLRQNWMRGIPHPRGLLLRVAEREIESWLLADHEAIVALIGKSVLRRLPDRPDKLPDPKAFLLTLAAKAARDVRRDLLPEPGAIASKGLGYNERLCDLVRTSWCPGRAAQRSPSLHRAMVRISELIA